MNTTKRAAAWLLSSALLLTVARQAHALWVEHRLTPATAATAHRLSFQVRAKDVDGGLKQFEVAVAPKSGNLSPVRTARLRVADGREVASGPVEEKQEAGGGVTYWFRIAPRFLANSKFEFGEHGHAEVKDAQGRKAFVGLPGGQGYWFYLRDFAAAR